MPENITSTPKTIAATSVEMMEIVLPNDANTLGNILGGKVMHLIDIACAISAHRHCRKPVVTASMDYLDFRHPIKVGELIIIRASVNRAFNTSMECGAKVFSENLETGERQHTSTAYLTFVALNENLKPTAVDPIFSETEEEKRRWEEAEIRREFRMKQKEALRQLR